MPTKSTIAQCYSLLVSMACGLWTVAAVNRCSRPQTLVTLWEPAKAPPSKWKLPTQYCRVQRARTSSNNSQRKRRSFALFYFALLCSSPKNTPPIQLRIPGAVLQTRAPAISGSSSHSTIPPQSIPPSKASSQSPCPEASSCPVSES